MPRAIGAFRQAGVPVEAYPVDYQTVGRKDLWRFSGSLSGGIVKADSAVHEWLGLFVYWITGRIPSLVPRSSRSETADLRRDQRFSLGSCRRRFGACLGNDYSGSNH